MPRRKTQEETLLFDDEPVRTHDPGVDAAAARAASLPPAGDPFPLAVALVRIGTAGWMDKTISASGVFYPPGIDTAEDRLRFYAEQFPIAEVDSTYYAIPPRRIAEIWIERSAPRFVFDVKAYALMTGHRAESQRLPAAIRARLPSALTEKGRIYGEDLPPFLYDEVWRLFREAVAPMQEAGRLGSVLLQYPRWFLPGERSRHIILDALQRLHGFRCAVELRNAAWFDGSTRQATLGFLAERRIPFVMVDGPQGLGSSVPPLVAVTSPDLSIVRFHGRRVETWESRDTTVAERYRYLYDRGELMEWARRVEDAASQCREVHVIMNNCYANYGTTNALEFADLLREIAKGTR